MENFIRRCSQYAAKIDDMSISLLNRQQQQQQQQQHHQQPIAPYDNHFQIVSNIENNIDGKHQQQQQQLQQQKMQQQQQHNTEQYSFKSYNYYHHHVANLKGTKPQTYYKNAVRSSSNAHNNNVKQQTATTIHQTTDNNNNKCCYTTTTTVGGGANPYYRDEPPMIHDDDNYEWLTTTDDMSSSSSDEDDFKEDFDNDHHHNDRDNDDDDNVYVAIKNDDENMPIMKYNNENNNYSMAGILLPALKLFGFRTFQQQNQAANHTDYISNNNGSNVARSASTSASDLIGVNCKVTKKNKKNKHYNKGHNDDSNNNNKKEQQQQYAENAALQQCRNKVLSACNKMLANLLTTTAATTMSTTVAAKTTATTTTTTTATSTTTTVYNTQQYKSQQQQKQQPHHFHSSNIINHHHYHHLQKQHQQRHHHHRHNNNHKQRQQQQFRLLPSLGTTSFLTLLTLICLETLLLTTVTDCAKTFYMHWNTSNSIFRIDNTDHIIDVNKGNLAFEFDQVHIICPVYEPGTYENETEKYIIYNVSKVEYETCRITNADPRVIAICDKPQKLMFFTITFRPFTPQPGGLEFLPGNDYYFISTSSKDDLYRRIGGRCSTNNMKVVFKVCCAPEDKNKTNASTIGGGSVGGGNAGGSNIATSGIATSSDTATVNMDNGGNGVGSGNGHQTHPTATQQLNKNMQVIGVNTAIMPIGGSSGTNPPLKPIKNGGGGGGISINTNIDQFNRIPLQQQTHGINIGNNMATSMGGQQHGGHTHGLDAVNNNGINGAINVVVSGNGNIGSGGGGVMGNAGNGIMLAPNHGILPANGIGISGYSNIGHTNGEIGIGTGIRINNVPTQQYHPPYKQGNNNKLNANGDEHHFNKHPNEVVKNEELTYNSGAYSLHHKSSATTVVKFIWKFIWKLFKNTCHGFVHVYHKFNSQIEIPVTKTTATTIQATKTTNEHLIERNLNAFNCILTKNNINFNTTKFQNSIVDLSVKERFCLNQATLDIKYLFNNFHPILLLILMLLIKMTAYYQVNSISLNTNIQITATRTNATVIQTSKRKEEKKCCSYNHHDNISNGLKLINVRKRQNDFIQR